MAEGTSVLRSTFRSLDDQAPLPLERLILSEAPDAEAIPMDVVFVGGGPAGLAGAIELARLVREDNEGGAESEKSKSVFWKRPDSSGSTAFPARW
jgi:NADH dehydrogenase FAD-containing subunit